MIPESIRRRDWLLAALAANLGAAIPSAGQEPRGGSQSATVRHMPGAVPILGEAGKGLEAFDEVMLDLFETHRIPGGSLSLAKEGRLVFARGYGWADVEARQPVRPDMSFGIASVSKAITAVGILRLVDDELLALDDLAFEILADLRPKRGVKVDPGIASITIRQLLSHSSGFERDSHPQMAAHWFPGEQPSSVSIDQIITFQCSRPLLFAPGTEARYSNFGFMVLGQVIARASGMPYARYIRTALFDPMGIRRAALGTRMANYPPGWVHRYDQAQKLLPPLPPSKQGAAGGWVTSSVALVRFLTALDGTRGAAILSKGAHAEMLAAQPPPQKPRKNGSHFGLGWDTVRKTPAGLAYSKNGGLPGVKSFIGHMPGNVDWAVLFNGGMNPEGAPDEDADAASRIQAAIRATTRWPDVDLFQRFS